MVPHHLFRQLDQRNIVGDFTPRWIVRGMVDDSMDTIQLGLIGFNAAPRYTHVKLTDIPPKRNLLLNTVYLKVSYQSERIYWLHDTVSCCQDPFAVNQHSAADVFTSKSNERHHPFKGNGLMPYRFCKSKFQVHLPREFSFDCFLAVDYFPCPQQSGYTTVDISLFFIHCLIQMKYSSANEANKL